MQVSYILEKPSGGKEFLRFDLETKQWLLKVDSFDYFKTCSTESARNQFEACKITRVSKPMPGYKLMRQDVYNRKPASCKACRDPLSARYSEMCQSCLLLLLDEENDSPALTLTAYEYQDQNEDDESDPDYALSDTLYKDEPMSFADVVRKIRDYWTVRTSCEPVCKTGHCWLSSDPDHPNFGDGGATYVDIFVKTLRGERVSGAILTKCLEAAKA